MGVGMRGVAIVAVLLGGLTPAWAESCLTTANTSSSSNVATSIGTFFQLGGRGILHKTNPPGITNAPAVTATGSSNPGTALTGLSCGAGATASNKQSVALGQGAQALAPNSVALGANSVATRANSVSVGSPAMPNQITNVAAGIAPTDAVNVSQLATVAGPLQSQITTLKKQTFAGISMAMAAAALQTGAGSQGSGKVALGLGGGEFGGTASVSAGIAYSPTKKLNFNAGVSYAPIVNMIGVFGGTTWTLN